MKRRLLVLMILMIVGTSAASQDVELSYDGLVKVPDSILAEAWIKPNVDLRPYNKIILEPVEISYRRKPPATSRAQFQRGNFALTPKQQQAMSDGLNEAIAAAMSAENGWEIVKDAGPDVLLVQAEIIDLEIRVPPNPEQVRGQTLSSATMGQLTLALEIRDSETREIFARASDRRYANVPGSNRMRHVAPGVGKREVRKIFAAWSEVLRVRLDQVKEISGK